jgi:hypothetical protein
MTDHAADLRALRQRFDDLAKQAAVIRREMNRVEADIMARRWAAYPIGSIAEDNKGVKYEVAGYENGWMLGKRFKKDGTPGSRMVPFQPVEGI